MSMSVLDRDTLSDLHDKEYAHEYMDDFLNTFIATQIKVLREQNEWTQERLAKESGMFQERISVLENVNNSAWSLKTLKQLARAFDVRLHVSFENFTTELEQFNNFTFESIVTKKSLERMPREQDISLAEKRLEVAETVSTKITIVPGTAPLNMIGGVPEVKISIETAAKALTTPHDNIISIEDYRGRKNGILQQIPTEQPKHQAGGWVATAGAR